MVGKTERYKSCGAVMLFLRRSKDGRQELLLQQRWNTGYADGMWDCGASGHVEEGESMKEVLIREAKEELGISIDLGDVEFATLIHKHTDGGSAYYNAFFVVDQYEGEPSIKEPEKCCGLQWFAMDELPELMISDRIEALKNYINHIPYSELGWNHRKL